MLLFSFSCAAIRIETQYDKKNDFNNVNIYKVKYYANLSYLAYKNTERIKNKYGKENVKVINTTSNGERMFIITDKLKKEQIIIVIPNPIFTYTINYFII